MDTVRIYHPVLDTYATIPETAFGQHVLQGWVEAEDEPQPEPPPTPKKTAAAKKAAASREAGTATEKKEEAK